MLYCFRTQDHGWIQRISIDGTSIVLGRNIVIFEFMDVEAEDFAEDCARKLNEKVTINEIHLKKIKTYDCDVPFTSISLDSKFYWSDVLFVRISLSRAVALENKNNYVLGKVYALNSTITVKKYD